MLKILAAVALLLAAAVGIAQDEELLSRGEYLIHAGGCITCHTEDVEGAAPLAGGYALESPFGTFFSPNITPDKATGIGEWSDDQFVDAFWEGVSPEGDHYFPAFPFTSYTGVSRDDLLAMKAYLFSLEPVEKENREHDLAWYMSTRLAAGFWKGRYFEPARFEPDPEKSDSWNRGAYLVRHLGHCGECHTPRTGRGMMIKEQELAGSVPDGDGESVPNITADPEDGIGKWSASDIEYFLEIGMLPDGDFTGSSMSDVIEDNTSHLTRDARLAIAEYLQSVRNSQETVQNR
jgi:mono/diheme cytochrome c family protein